MLRTVMMSACLLSLVVSAARAQGEPGPRVQIDSGVLRGRVADGVAAFKGIPYAAAPVGPLRWRPPQPVSAWSGERDATDYSNDCLQNKLSAAWFPSDWLLPTRPTSEDCLYLNVWAPAHRSGAALPVMVWIHGGGFLTGSGAAPEMVGTGLAQKGMVVVTFNYRLGRFGFFAHPSLVRDHPDEAVGNYGLMDQIAVLGWVQRNIAAFGGDPGNVTIFGQSAGGVSVLRLMISPPARNMFARAIVESGGGRERWARLDAPIAGRPSALSVGEAFARHAGAPDADAAKLRALPAKTVLGNLRSMAPEADTYSGPMVDGRIVPGDVDTMFERHEEAKAPLLIGANSDELGMMPDLIVDAMTKAGVAKLGPGQAAVVGNYRSGKTRRADLLSDVAFVEPSRFLAGCHAASGAPTFLYRFSYVAEAKRPSGAGAGHSSEIPYVFDTVAAVAPDATDADRKMAATVSGYWTAFARTGNPNGSGGFVWPNFDRRTDVLMNFTAEGPVVQQDPIKPRLDAITNLNPVL
ncbi:MAG TPA: carboxylesterase family protein [Caulobacteraceae bacterium]|nr:carboxylesterase family protein [Caulobacteraceae bacterium]